MFDQTFVLPQLIISNKHCIYELPHELPKDLRLGKCQEKLKKCQKSS